LARRTYTHFPCHSSFLPPPRKPKAFGDCVKFGRLSFLLFALIALTLIKAIRRQVGRVCVALAYSAVGPPGHLISLGQQCFVATGVILIFLGYSAVPFPAPCFFFVPAQSTVPPCLRPHAFLDGCGWTRNADRGSFSNSCLSHSLKFFTPCRLGV